MTTSYPTYFNIGTTPKEIQQSANKVFKTLRRLQTQPIDYSEACPKLLYFKSNFYQETESVLYGIKQSLMANDLLQNLKTTSRLKQQLQKLISTCSLLEMKNNTLKELSHHLKIELIRLKQLHLVWCNATCLKN